MQAKSKVLTEVVDDMTKNASAETKMYEAMDRVSNACDNYDLKEAQIKFPFKKACPVLDVKLPSIVC